MLHCIPARWYLTLAHWIETGQRIDWQRPTTFSEKLHWLKVYGDTARFGWLVDKADADARAWIARLIGSDHLIPRIGVHSRPEDIPWDDLPRQFVVKCAHGSHCGIVCTDKDTFDRAAAIRKLHKWQRRNWYWYGREPPYRRLAPRIVVEHFIGEGDQLPDDFKVMTFGGRAEVTQLHRKRGSETTIDFFGRDGQRLEMDKPGYRRSQERELPRGGVIKLLQAAEAIASAVGTPYLRVDLYLVGNHVYFGEATFFDSAGFKPFLPAIESWLGGLIHLPTKGV